MSNEIRKDQSKMKERYDRKRKIPKTFKEGDLVLVAKNIFGEGTSRKLIPRYSGPMVVKKVLPNDPNTTRSYQRSYKNVCAIDKLKSWVPISGMSDASESESGSDGVPLPIENESD